MKGLLRAIWVVIVMVIALGVVRLVRTAKHRSPDQKILIQKSK